VGRTVYQLATIIDGLSNETFTGSLVVEGPRILEVGRQVDQRDGDDVVDCSGKFICPGFIDSHCHLIYRETQDFYEMELARSIPEATIDAVVNAELLLSQGFTTVRDLGSRANIGVMVRDAIAAGLLRGPTVLAAGNIISTVGGLLDGHPSHIFEGTKYRYGHGEIITGPWEARNAVRRQVKDGVDWIKTETSGTGFNPLCPADRDTISEEEFEAVVDEAHRKRRPIAVHAESREGVIKAARAGVHTIEHGIYMDNFGLDLMLENGIAYSPTLALYVHLADGGLDVGIPRAIVELQRATRDQHIASVQTAYKAGATIIAGSDAGVPGFPQGGTYKEIELYVNYIGMTPLQAIQTATSVPAKVFGLEDSIGALEPGRYADFIILSADPTVDITVLQDPQKREAVFKAGQLVVKDGMAAGEGVRAI